MQMVTSNVIHRILNIRIGNSQGTAFTVDRRGKQYLVTARHVVAGIAGAQRISVVRKNQWKNIDINVVGIGEGEVDVAVLACSQQLSPTYPMEPDDTGMVYGQQAYFLGFPFGWSTGGQHVNHGLPLPFVKEGIISAFTIDGPVSKIYLDAYVNEGFSGGPVVFQKPGRREAFRVAGVVAGYPTRFQPVVDGKGNVVAQARENPGLVLALGIRHVVALIDRNPVGFTLPNG